MTDLKRRVEALSPEKRHLLESLRRERKGGAPAHPAPTGGGEPAEDLLRVPPFGLLSAEDRARLPAGVEDAFPLTMVQLGMLHHMELTAGDATPAYHNVNSFHIRAPFVAERFQEAVDAVVRRHPQLRISFDLTGFSEPLQLVHERAELRVAVEDLRHLEAAEQKRFLQRFIAEENRNLLDLGRAPLIRLRVHRWADDRFSLTLTEPHAISDGWSTAANLEEIFQGYLARMRGETPAEAPPPPVTFRDFVALERRALASPEQRDFWTRQLSGPGAPRLSRIPWSPAAEGERDRKPSVWFPAEVVEGLQRLARAAEVPLKSVLLAGHLKVISLYAGGGGVVTGLTTHGRPEALGGEQVRGLFLNTVPLSFDFPAGSWIDLARAVFRRETEIWPHRRYPLAAMQRLCGRRTLFESAFSFLHFHSLAQLLSSGEGEKIEEGSSDLSVTEFPLMSTFTLRSVTNALRLTLEHDAHELGAAQVLEIGACYERVLAAMAADPWAPHDAVPLLPGDQQRLLFEEWNQPGAAFSRGPCLHRIFEEQAARRPDAVAVVWGERRLTYRDLNRRANQVAHCLRGFGVGPESLVGLYVERSPEVLVGLLGVLKAGGAYVPMDPAYPRERLAHMLADSGLRLLLTQESLRPNLPGTAETGGVRVLCLDGSEERIARAGVEDPVSLAGAENAAYVIYTSGSTGRPKGVVVPHGNAVRLFGATGAWFGFGAEDVWTLFHSHAFDFSVWELWGALLHGGRLVVVPHAVSRSPEDFHDLLVREGVTVLNQTPSAFQQLIAVDRPDRLSALRLVIFGGEAVSLPALAPWVERYGAERPRLVNMYGITETTVHVTYRPLTAADVSAPAGAGSPIGRAMPDLQLYVLDRFLQPLPVGVEGEIHVGGDGLARGYLGRAELTAERFLPDPFRGQAGARLYKTGDLGRYLPGGDVEYLGRIDRQVKVRGFRIELGEIEAALAAHPAVRQAVVVLREDVPGDKRLVGYVAARTGETAPAALRAFLKERLPEYMIPAALVLLEALPLTVNGKVDLRALPAPEGGGAEGDDLLQAAPRNLTEELLAGIWSEVLDRERVGRLDNFFELGGHSLLATQLIGRVRKTFQVDLPLTSLFEEPTVAGLARRVESALGAAERPQAPPIVPVPRSGDLPLSFSQQRLWFLDQLEPGGTVYNIPAAVRLRGPLRVGALAEAFAGLVRRHEVLRTVFPATDGNPRQEILPPAPVPLPLADLSGLSEVDREEQVRRLSAAEARRPFDLARGPVLRVTLLRLSADEHVVLTTLHHIASDGWSIGILNRELAALYGAAVREVPAALPELPLQYADFAVWQRRWLDGEVLEGEIDWWRRRLAGMPPALPLPADRPRPAVPGRDAARRALALPPPLSSALTALGRLEGATLFMVLLAGFQALLRDLTGSEDLSVGTPVAGRRHVETEGLIGFFVNTLVLRADLSGNPTFRDLLARVRTLSLEAQVHQDLPFEKLVEQLDPERDLSRNPLFQVMFGLQNAPRESLAMSGLEASVVGPQTGMAAFDLTLLATERPWGIEATLGYKTELFDATTVERFLGHFRALLEQAAARPGLRLDELAPLSESERHALLFEWSRTEAEPPSGALVHELFQAQARRSPEAAALLWGGEELRFEDLRQRVARLARHLRGRGVGPETTVGLSLPRTPDLITAMLATLAAGGAYVPLDPAYPAERLALLLEDARPRVLLTVTALRDRLPAGGAAVVCLDDPADREMIERESAVDLPRVPVPESLAYVIYTSGSTGRPKGVGITHRGAAALLAWAREAFSRDELAGMLASTSINFDLSVFEIFAPLAWGGTVILAENALHLPELPAAAAVRLVNTVPSAIAELVRAGVLPAGVRTVSLAGEALPAALVEQLYALPQIDRVLNLYGPSEDTTYSTGAVMPRGGGLPTIGRPVAGSRAWLLDRRLRPVPAGCAGEIFLAGDGLARGYLDRPDATAAAFLPDPFSESPGGRMYRTGDLARYGMDGQLRFLGRADHQVKVRGFRIELGEIEVVLSRHPAVEGAVVLAPEDASGGRRLVAYVAVRAGSSLASPLTSLLSGEELRLHLQRTLPAHMVPAAFVLLPALPLNANGKVDRRALAALPVEEEERETGPQAPRTPTEEILAGIWAELLGGRPAGGGDDFFRSGGHSLLAMQAVSRLRRIFGIDIPLRVLFETPVLSSLAARIDDLRQRDGRAERPLAPVPRTGPLPLSFAQQRLWLIDRLQPSSPVYNMPLSVRLDGDLRPDLLERTFAEIVRRHEVLRTSFPAVDGVPVQAVAPAGEPRLPLIDLSGLPPAAGLAEAYELAREEAARPFDLARGPLFRAALLRLEPGAHVLLATMHHAVSDEWSMRLFFREIAALYPALREGRPARLPELPVQYADFAVWQRQWLDDQRLATQIDFWKQRLGDEPPVLELPADRPRPSVQSFRGGRRSFQLTAEVSAALRQLARKQGATLFMTLFAVFQVLLRRVTGQWDVAVGTPISGRSREEVENLIGFFLNTLVLRVRLPEEPSFRDLLAHVRAVSLDAYANQDVPFERLIDELQPRRSLSTSPLFQAMFVLLHAEATEEEALGLRASAFKPLLPFARFDLTLALTAHPDHLAGLVEHSTDLFDAVTIERLIGHLRHLAESAAAAPEVSVADLPLLGAAERHQLLHEWGVEAPAEPLAAALLHAPFEAMAAAAPERPALVFPGGVWSYGELDRRAGQVAHRLRGLGVGPETLVGVCMRRRPELIAALLGVLKAGGAYVPLDPRYPAHRLAFMLEDAAARVVLTDGDSAEVLPEGTPRLFLDQPEVWSGEPATVGTAVDSHHLAYLIYTSGSTGRPKGVALEHRSGAAFLSWAARAFSPGELSGVLAATSISFDLSIFEIFGPLSAGGRVILADDALHLASLEAAGEVTLVNTVPSAIAELLRLEALPASVRTVNLAGEPLPRALAERIYALETVERVYNLYGPTEDTTYSTWARVQRGATGAPSIGRAIAGGRVALLDRALQPAAPGVPGEICLGGAGLARGYLGRPELTAERFIPDGSAGEVGEPGARLYRTGDLGRWRPDGTLELIGRMDHQVKIRGFRIELGEIEAALRACPGVREAVVAAREDAPGDWRLVAYVVSETGGAGASGPREWLTRLRATLPDYMLPSVLVPLEALPLTSNGKVDRRALPSPDGSRGGERDYVAPESALEQVLAGIWAELLRVERVGLRDDFFELGGHSLLGTRLLAKVQSIFGADLPLRALFQEPALAGFAAAVVREVGDPELVEQIAGVYLEVEGLSEEEKRALLAEGEGDS